MTKNEKEKLFNEFAERLNLKVDTESATYKNKHNLERSRDHFEEKRTELSVMYTFSNVHNHGISYQDWSHIVRLVCHTFGASTVSSLRPEILVEANDLAIRLTDIIFETNNRVLKELES